MKKFLLLYLLLTSFNINIQASDIKIQDIENYLNSIKTFKADFLQEDSLNNTVKGVIYIKKPAQFRLETFEPSHTVLVGDKSLVIYHDYELNETTHTTPNNGAISLLVEDNINFNSKKVKIKSFKNTNSTIEIEFIDNSQPDLGTMTVLFSKDPIELRQIRVSQNDSKLIMNLYNRKTNIQLNEDNFIFQYPKIKNPYNNQR